MRNLMGRRELLGGGIGLYGSLGASSAVAQSSETARRESGTDALGRRVGTGSRGKQIPKRMAKTTKLFLTPPGWPNDVDKIWIDANRLEALIRIDPKTWEVDYMFPTTRVPGLAERLHGIAYDNGFIWQVTGHQKEGTTVYEGYTPGLVKYEVTTGQVVQVVEFVPGSCDMHDVAVYDDQ